MTGPVAFRDVGRSDSNKPVNYDGDKDYTAYDRLLTNTRGLSTTDPTTTLDTWMSQMCTAIKQNGDRYLHDLFNNSTVGNPDPVQELRLVPQQLLPEPHTAPICRMLQADWQGAVHIAVIAMMISI